MAYRAAGAFLAVALALGGLASSSGAAETTQYSYDALGRVISAIDQSGKKVAYTYDSAGNRTRVSNGAEFAEITPTAWSASSNAGTTGLTAANGMRDGAFTALASIHATNVETNPWIMADLGSVQNVNHIEVTAAIASTLSVGLADINDTAIEYSLDGTVWNAAATIEGISPAAPRSISLGGVALRYLRIRRTVSGRVALGDLRLYSAAAANTPLIANPDSITSTGGAVTFDPRANDQDLDGNTIAISGVDVPPHGTAVINAGVSLTYTPNPGYFGADSFLYTVTDGHNGAASARVSVMVQSSANHPPVAVNDQFTISDRATAVVDGINTLRPLNNDYDPDGDVLTITGTSTPAHGAISVVGSTIVQYQPTVGYSGSDSFTYTISDGRGLTSVATVTVSSGNTNPLAVQDNIRTSRGIAVTVDPRLNDSDPNGDAITIGSITQPANGAATLNANQTVTYTPTTGFVGGDSLTYALSDGRGGTATGTIAITVTPNGPPVAVGDSISAAAATPVTFDPRSNDSDPENRPLTIITLTAPSHGTAVLGTGGTAVTYTAATGYSGPDSFTYTISDDQGSTATALVAVNALSVEYLVVAGGGGGANAVGGGGGGGGVLQGVQAMVVGSTAITVGSGGANGSSGDSGTASSIGASLVANGGGGGGFSSTPFAAKSGGSGGGGGGGSPNPGGSGTSGQGHNGGNSGASAAGGGGAGSAGGAGTSSSQAGAGGFGLTTSISGTPTDYGAGGGGGGNVNSDDSISIARGAAGGASGGDGGNPGANGDNAPVGRGGGGGGGGAADATHGLGGTGGSGIVILRYPGAPKASGGTITQVGGYTIHTFTTGGTFSVGTTNTGPTAVNDSIVAASGLPLAFDPRTNDTDANGDSLTVVAVTAPSHGTAIRNPNPGPPVIYTASFGYTGADSFTYMIGDGQGLTSTATVSVTVTGGVQVDYLVVGGGGGGGASQAGGGGGGQVRTGSLLMPSGPFAVTIGAGGAGALRDFNFQTVGADGGSTAWGAITSLGGGGGASQAAGTSSTGANGGGGSAYAMAGGGSANGGYVGGSSVPAPTAYASGAGGAGAGANGGLSFVHTGGGIGGVGVSSSISGSAVSYAAGGGGGGSSDAPAIGAAGDSSGGQGGGHAAPANRGGGGGGGSYSAVGGNGGSGVVILRYLTGAMTATGGTITTSGGYTIHTFTTNGTFSIPNRAPIAVNDTVSATAGTALPFDPRTNDSDPDGDTLSISGVGTPSHGTATIANGNTQITYTAATGYSGSDSFSYTISDGHGLTAMATVSVTVAAASSPATYVNSGRYNLLSGTDNAIPIPSGAAAGDLLVVAMVSTGNHAFVTLTANGSGEAMAIKSGPDNITFLGWMGYLFSKTLTAGDISSGVLSVANSATDSPLVLTVYRGANTLTYRGLQSVNGAGQIVQPGFTPSASSKGVIAPTISFSAPGPYAVTVSPGTWAQHTGPMQITWYAGITFDELSGYTNAGVTFNSFGNSTVQYLAELSSN